MEKERNDTEEREVVPVPYPFGRPLPPPLPKGASKWRLKSQCGVGGAVAGGSRAKHEVAEERERKRWGVVCGAGSGGEGKGWYRESGTGAQEKVGEGENYCQE